MSMTDLYKVFDQTVREITREVNRSILKVPEIEQKTLDATSNEPWGPHGQVMNEIARATRNFHEYQMIMAILWKRLQDTGAMWRHVYKTLVVMEFLVANGSERVIDELRENMYQIQCLVEFQYTEPSGKDQGINVRKKAQTLIALLKDREKIREAREKAAANRNKYGGLSSTSYRSGGMGNSDYDSGYGGGGGGGGGRDRGRDRDDYDSYRSGEGGTGRRGSGYGGGDSNGGRREDRYSRQEGYGDEDRSRGRGGRDYEGGGDYKQEGYSHAGGTALQDDDDFEPRGKSERGGGAPASGGDDDFDDFDPRGTAKPAPTAAPAKPPPAAPSAPAPAPANLLDDLFGPAPAAAPAAAAPVDPFAALSSPAPPAGDFFGAPAAAAPGAGSAFSPFAAAPAPPKAPAPASDDFEDDDFGGFAAAPSAAPSAGSFGGLGGAPAARPAPAAPQDPFGMADPFGSFASASPAKPAAPASLSAPPSATKGTPSKGGLWEDAISKGIVDLKISGGKEQDLSSLGIMADGLGISTSNLNPTSNIPFTQQSGGMGRAMGTGSGKGIAGANVLASPPLMPMGSPGMPPAMGYGSMGGVASPPARPLQQPAGMAFGASPMGMSAFPSPGMPGAAGGSLFGTPGAFPGPQQHQQQPGAGAGSPFQF